MKYVTPVEITPASTSAWTDVDVTAYVGADAGSVAGVMLQIVNVSSSTEFTWGVRKNGSTDTLTAVIEDGGHTFAAIGVDSGDIFECYVTSTTSIDIYLVGYILTSEGSFFTNAVDKSLTVADAWTDVDISGDTGADTAKVAFLLVHQSGAGSLEWGLRQNGSTDNIRETATTTGWVDLRGAMIGVDANEIFEGYIGVTSIDFYLVGYLTANVTTFTNRIDYTGAVQLSYIDVDFSADIPAGNDGAF
ncbi:MAG TPA: hypothetical protein VJL10_10710, partial [Anaerolineales bacterium]|nr:hypothetical protein [Anaerolineales bacterium]